MRAKKEPSRGIWISGVNPVKEALLHRGLVIHEMILSREDQRVKDFIEMAHGRGIVVRHENRDALSSLVGHTHHQGIAILSAEFSYTPLEVILDRDENEREPLVILDSLQDPQNFGAIARSACFLGAKALVVPKDRSVQVTSTVIKISAGAMSYVPVVQVVNLARTLEKLKEAGIWIAGLDLDADQSIYETDLSLPLGIVIGNEQKGLRPLIRKQCDILMRIPVYGPLQSLNAAAAGAIALAEVQRQRSKT